MGKRKEKGIKCDDNSSEYKSIPRAANAKEKQWIFIDLVWFHLFSLLSLQNTLLKPTSRFCNFFCWFSFYRNVLSVDTLWITVHIPQFFPYKSRYHIGRYHSKSVGLIERFQFQLLISPAPAVIALKMFEMLQNYCHNHKKKRR